ncbi:DUF4862 family protein [Microbulbifer thermotolerans]|uniref:DUF4862 family protein n=1 Tax=Microbulbifer thermotolerans TaxID=252514 RepID=UPI00224B5B5A|nr:DUF4862 family protein [Microbulbifer thermotolerans]MCX2780480.1 DUF4862 family protein [Microbulbifer thermotolerans]MCX2784079.1 DUF4862 family protein [Microbulbifer thermotolerans]MCX2806016.1 DUF4862 family protein [Microbulbifer thermotolerans]MCX2835803.1 DUF4862 family protein [Microbulbifer thermotolerans]MCX2842426.1 DUF4862 family protein [Microbulbifer thermotolerans]
MKYILAAYATAPVTETWQPELQARYLNGIKQLGNIRGIEHPFTGHLHPHDDQWFLENIDPGWDFVFTGVPGIMQRLGDHAAFGIASDDAIGRAEGIAFYRQMREAVLKLNQSLGRKAVDFIQLHTSPNRARAASSTASLIASLEEIQSWDWDGAQLVIEHCDAHIEGAAAEKGFLTLEEEIQAVQSVNQRCGCDIGLSINWGRSALEARSVEGPLSHLRQAREAGLLRGLMFSGVSPEETPYGAWCDTHMPPAPVFAEGHFAETSLLTAEQIAKSLEVADWRRLDFLGIKIGVRPRELNAEERVAYNRDALAALDMCTERELSGVI